MKAESDRVKLAEQLKACELKSAVQGMKERLEKQKAILEVTNEAQSQALEAAEVLFRSTAIDRGWCPHTQSFLGDYAPQIKKSQAKFKKRLQNPGPLR